MNQLSSEKLKDKILLTTPSGHSLWTYDFQNIDQSFIQEVKMNLQMAIRHCSFCAKATTSWCSKCKEPWCSSECATKRNEIHEIGHSVVCNQRLQFFQMVKPPTLANTPIISLNDYTKIETTVLSLPAIRKYMANPICFMCCQKDQTIVLRCSVCKLICYCSWECLIADYSNHVNLCFKGHTLRAATERLINRTIFAGSKLQHPVQKLLWPPIFQLQDKILRPYFGEVVQPAYSGQIYSNMYGISDCGWDFDESSYYCYSVSAFLVKTEAIEPQQQQNSRFALLKKDSLPFCPKSNNDPYPHLHKMKLCAACRHVGLLLAEISGLFTTVEPRFFVFNRIVLATFKKNWKKFIDGPRSQLIGYDELALILPNVSSAN